MSGLAFVRKSLTFLFLAVTSLAPMYGQVPITLSTPAPNPSRAGDLATMSATGIPAGALAPGAVSIELTPYDASFGPAVVVLAESIGAVPLSTDRLIKFRIPSSLRSELPFTVRVSARGTLGAISFASAAPRSLNVSPAARLTSVTPPAGSLGQTLAVAIRGRHIQFTTSSIRSVAFSDPSVTVTSYTVDAVNQIINANLSVAAGAATGPRTLIVTLVSGQLLSLPDAFYVTGATAGTVAISPAACTAGDVNVAVSITGTGTNFLAAVPAVNLGDSVIVSGVTVLDATRLTAKISCDRLAVPGLRTLTVVTGATFAVAPNVFQLRSTNPAVSGVTPASGVQGTTVRNLRVTATNSGFLQGATRLTLIGPGYAALTVGDITVSSDGKELRAEVSIPPAAPAGGYALTLVTGGETFGAPNAFTVTAGSPEVSSFSPGYGVQGQSATVRVATRFFNFVLGTTVANFGSGITVNTTGVTVSPSPAGPTIQFPVTIAPAATLGVRTVTLTTGSTVLSFPFNVQASDARISSISPVSGYQGQSVLALAITGLGTNFVNGTTTVEFRNAYRTLPVTRTAVTSLTALNLDLYIPPGVELGGYTVTVQTGGQTLTLLNGFNVLPATPVLSISPSSISQGTTQTVIIQGQFTHFTASSTVQVVPGDDITVGTPQVVSPIEIRVPVTVGPLAVIVNEPGGYLNRYLAVNTTVPSPIGDYPENLTASFAVAPGNARILSISPNSASPGETLTVTVTGLGTNFAAGLSRLGLCATVLTNPATVGNTLSLQAQIRVEPGQGPGKCDVTVTTKGEKALLVDGFSIVAALPVTPSISGITPASGAQGQSLTVDVSTLNFTVNAGTTANLGEGIVVNSLTPLTASTARLNIAIRPRALLGGRTVTLTTGAQAITSATPIFSVTPGIATLSILLPATARQGQNLPVTITGLNSNFQSGLSTANFGTGITVNQFTVLTPLTAAAIITVARTSPLGLRNVTVNTEGEAATIVNGFNITQAVPQLLSLTPGSGRQAQTLDVTVFGESTSFSSLSLISLGNGISQVGVPTVTSDTSATFRIAVSPTAVVDPPSPGRRLLRVTTGAQILELPDAFQVTAGTATLLSAQPGNGLQGENVTITVTGQSTNFAQGVTSASFSGTGIIVGNVTVTDRFTAQITVSIARSAATGLRSLTLTTGGENAALANAFRIDPGTPVLTTSSPVSAAQGQTVTVTLVGQFTKWQQTPPTVSFGEGITTNSVVAVNDETLTVGIAVGPLAGIGGRVVTVSGGNVVVSANIFSVTAGPARLLSVTPGLGTQAQSLPLTILGDQTHFDQNITTLNFGAGVTVNLITVNSPTRITVDVTVATNATPGLRNLSVTTGGESLSLPNAFTVVGGTPAISGISPAGAQQGATLSVSIAGAFTTWAAGTSVDFGAGVNSSFTISNNFNIIANITISPTAIVGARTVRVVTGAQELTATFNVALLTGPSSPSIQSVSPPQAAPGQTLTISVVGANTHFALGQTAVAIGAGITVNQVSVLSPTSLLAQITLDPGAAPGARGLTVSTGGETVNSGFSVVVGTPRIISLSPTSGPQGTTQTVQVNAELTTFTAATIFDFGAGITVTGNITSPVSAELQLQIAPTAAATQRQVTATTGTQIASGGLIAAYTVSPSNARLVSMTPARAKQNEGPFPVIFSGSGTHFVSGTTTVSISGVTLTNVVVTSPIQITATATVSPAASVGAASVAATTGGEVASLTGGFIIDPGVPVLLSSSPVSARQQEAFTLLVQGRYTKFVSAATVSLGNGVTIDSVTAASDTQLSVAARVNATADVGIRNLTVTSPVDGPLTLASAFTVQAGPATLNLLSPNSGKQGDTVPITIQGSATNFEAGVTEANFGPGVTVQSLNVTSRLIASATLVIDAGAPVSIRNATFTTRGEVATLANGFTVTAGTPVIRTVAPISGKQGQTLDVVVNSLLTTFSHTATLASFGPGVTVNLVTVESPIRLTANITVTGTAALGARTLSVTTGAEVVSLASAFSVTVGDAILVPAAPAALPRGKKTTVTVNGQGTNFLAGTTTLTAGDLIVSALTIVTPLRLTVDLQVPPLAADGVRTLTVTTAGEVVTSPNLVSAVPGDPAITSFSPSSGAQGATVNGALSTLDLILGAGPQPYTIDLGAGVTPTWNNNGGPTGTLSIVVSPHATVGPRTLTLTSGGRTATLVDAFTVTRGPAAISSILPGSLRQGDVVNVSVIGTSTNFVQGTTALDFGAGITVSNLVVNSGSTLSAQVTAGETAVTGNRAITATTSGEIATLANYPVNPGIAIVTQITPNTGRQGANLSLSVTGRFTAFTAGTTASLGAGVTVNTVTVTSPTAATVAATILPTAALGSRTLSLSTAGNTVALTDAITVTKSDAALVSVAPSTLTQGATQTLTLTGTLTNFDAGTTVSITGTGVTLGTLVVGGPLSLTVPATATDIAALGGRDITVTTGGEVVTLNGALSILAGTPAITSVTPATVAQKQTLTATLNTRFLTLTGPITVTFPGDTRVTAGNVTIVNANQLTADITVQGPATLGAKTLTITAGAQSATLASAFSVTAGPAAIVSFTGNQVAQASSGTVAVTGGSTSFEQGLTTADLGAGVTTTVTVISPTQATVLAVVAANAAPGVRPIVMRTGGETATSATGGFAVLAGVPVITSVTPIGGTANSTLIVTVAGTNLGGATFALGGGAGVNATGVTTTSTSAAFSLNLSGVAIGDYPIVATNAVGSSQSVADPGNAFRVLQASGYADSTVSVLNIYYDPANNPSPQAKFASAASVSVLNIYYDPANNTGAVSRFASAASVSVLNIFFDPGTNAGAESRFASGAAVSVLNIFYDGSGGSGLAPGQSAAASPSLVVRNTAAAPATLVLQPATESLPAGSVASAARRSGVLPLALGLQGKVYPGQTLRLQVADADGREGSLTTVLANRVAVAALRKGDPDVLFTVPYGVANIDIQLLIRDDDGAERTSQPVKLEITPDMGLSLSGVVKLENGQPADGAELSLYAGGLLAEVFRFDQAVSRRPDLTDLTPARSFIATSVNQPNPEAVFGVDPLGLGRADDTAVRYRGWLFLEESGTYRFWLKGRPGAAIRIGDTHQELAADAEELALAVELTAGMHPVEILYWKGVGAESLEWTWQAPVGRREPVSPQVLRTKLPETRKAGANGEFSLPRVPLAIDTLWVHAGPERSPVVTVIPQPRMRQLVTKPLEITLPATTTATQTSIQ